MLKKHISDVPATKMEKKGFQGMTARFALTKDDGMPHYALRVMEFEPGGFTSLHAHEEEHEFYFLDGMAIIADDRGNATSVRPGDVVYIEPNEPHQIRNEGTTLVRVVCTIPILPGGDGKMTTQHGTGVY